MLFYPEERIGLFIDGSNLYSAARSLGFDIDYKRLLDLFGAKGRLIRAFYYTALLTRRSHGPHPRRSLERTLGPTNGPGFAGRAPAARLSALSPPRRLPRQASRQPAGLAQRPGPLLRPGLGAPPHRRAGAGAERRQSHRPSLHRRLCRRSPLPDAGEIRLRRRQLRRATG